MQKKTTNSFGTFNFKRTESLNSFFCERCEREKKSKIVVKWTETNGNEKVICNGCYGFLLSHI